MEEENKEDRLLRERKRKSNNEKRLESVFTPINFVRYRGNVKQNSPLSFFVFFFKKCKPYNVSFEKEDLFCFEEQTSVSSCKLSLHLVP